MPTKFQLITELYDQTVQSVTGSYQSWTGFLRAACYNYKCPFDEQLLIYAQRPDATAVLEMERWNRQFGRWVNRGAKSIAVFGDDGQNCLKLYFDVSDTHASRFARPLPIWTMHPAFEPEVIETLEATFGNLAEKENLADAVRSACHNAVADNFTDYLQDLRECREDSLLEELDDLNLEVFYRDALEVSVAYMLMTRLGLRADDYFTADEFAHVYEFNTPPTVNALGIATSDIAEMGLREISRTVMQAQREQLFANAEKSGYDNSTEHETTEHERSEHHGSDLSDAGRLSGAEPADAADAGGASGQVRGAASAVPDEAPQSALHQPENQRQADGASLGDRADRAEDGGADRGADGTGRGRDGGTESDRSPALDGPDEQSPAQRGGAGAERPDLQLTTEEPTEAGSDELPAFVDHSGDYVLLDRLRADCDYFLGAGGRSEKHLWAGNVHAQIKKMRELYDALPEKPEWLTAEAIDRYAAQMAAPYQVAAYHHFENGFDDKLDYQTLEEAEAAAQGYVAGTMEEDGFAYPAEVRASEENGVYRLEKVYYLTATDDPTTIPTADFEREGRTYTLLDLLKNDQTETDTREHIEVVTLESKTKDMTEILKMLEPKLEVKTKDGYGNTLGSAVYPAAKLTIPALHLKDRRGVRALGVDQNLIIEGAFVIVAGRAEKARPALIAAGDALHSLVIQLCDKLKFGWQGSHLLSLRLRPLFYCKPVILLLFFLGLFKWLPLIAINIKLVITFNRRTAEHIHILFGFYHESAGGKQRTLDGADPLIPVAVAVHAVEVPQRGVRLFPQPVYGTVNIGLKLRRIQCVLLVGPPCCVKLLAAAKITTQVSHTARRLVLFLAAGEIESVQRRLIDAVKVNDIFRTGGIFLLKFRKGTASAILKGKAAALQRNPPINGKLERLAGENGAIEVDHETP